MFYNSGLTRLRERRLVSDMKCVATQQHRPQPNIWSPFQALTVPHNRSLLFIFETLVMSLLLLSPQDNSSQ